MNDASPQIEGAPLIAPSSTDHPIYDQVVEACRSVYDPEIPVNNYDLGLIYTLDIKAENENLAAEVAKLQAEKAARDEIIELSDAIMVARGDLGVELPPEEVPILQKRLINTSNRLGIPVITATQMLDSMVNNPRPTRAEVSDIANAILDGTDAVMLSNETAVGKHPVEAVATMARVALRTEQENFAHEAQDMVGSPRSIPNAISQAVARIASQLSASAIMTLTKSGATARNVSKFRPKTPILAVTPHVSVSRQLQLVWGVRPLVVLDLPSASQTFQAAMNVAQEKGFLREGDLVVMTAGTLQGISGSTDLIKVDIETAVLGTGVGIGEGAVSGRARVAQTGLDVTDFNPGEILVVTHTSADYVEAIRQAGGIVTEDDNLTGHAAVLGLRLGIPVIVGVKNATETIRDGTILTLDTRRGLVYSGSLGAVRAEASLVV